MFALVTATWNSIDTIAESVDSIRQCKTPVRQIFVDGSSTDGTAEYLETLASESPLVSLHRQKGRGLYEALNEGIGAALEYSDTQYIGLLHSDDYVMPEAFDRYLASITGEQAQVYYSDIVFHDAYKNVVRRWSAGDFSKFKLNTGWMPPHTSMIVSREVYEKTGVYDPAFGTAADYDWIVRVMSDDPWRVVYFHETTVAMRTGGASNVNFGARLRANAMDGRVWSERSRLQAAMIRVMKPARKIGQFF